MQYEIRAAHEAEEARVLAAAHIFDNQPSSESFRKFLREPNHYMFVALDAQNAVVGFVTGVETTHPDKGTEMFLYELSVAEEARRNGIGKALVQRLAALAQQHGCYGMWVGTEHDNEAALSTYASAGAKIAGDFVAMEWKFTDDA